jgi:hypothetical protein
MVLAQTDAHGKLEVSSALKIAASLFVQLVREENDSVAHFTTAKSSYTGYADTGDQSVPGMVFDLEGPHFRDTSGSDMSMLTQNADEFQIE